MSDCKLPILLSSNWLDEDVESLKNLLKKKLDPENFIQKYFHKENNFEIKKIEKDEEKKKIAEKAVQETQEPSHSSFLVIHYPTLSKKPTPWFVEVDKIGSKLKSSIISFKPKDYETIFKNKAIIFLKHVYENQLEKKEIEILETALAAHKKTTIQKIEENIEKKIEKVEEKFEKVKEKPTEESPSNLKIMDYNFLPDFLDTSFCYVDLLEKPGTEKKVDISVYKKDKNIKQKLHQTEFAKQDEICSLLIGRCNVGSV
jgi:hypothetical protein